MLGKLRFNVGRCKYLDTIPHLTMGPNGGNCFLSVYGPEFRLGSVSSTQKVPFSSLVHIGNLLFLSLLHTDLFKWQQDFLNN